MAELEEIAEVIGEAQEGIEAEGVEAGGAGEAEATDAELATEVEEAAESASTLRRCVDTLREISWSQAVRKFAIFVAKNAAIGAILYGVNVLLKKTFGSCGGGGHRGGGGADQQKIQQKQKKVKAFAQLTSDVAKALNKLAKWAEEKKEVTVTLEGMPIPLPDILSKFTKQMEKGVEDAFKVAKQLQKKDGDAKPTFVVPTTEQVNQLINSSESIFHTLQEIISFVDAKKEKFPDLEPFPVETNDVKKISDDLADIMKLPYA